MSLPTPYYSDELVTIYLGDSREILPAIGTASLLLTDPPYSISVAGAAHTGVVGKGTRSLDFFEGDDDWTAMTALALGVVAESVTHLTPNGSAYIWCGHRQFGGIVSHFEGAGWATRFLVWSKLCPAPPPPGSGWPSGAELCVYAYRPGRVWTARANPPRSNVLVYDGYRYGNGAKVDHPTQKPTVMFGRLIDYSTEPGDTVLDPFMGSGTTLVAAKSLNRHAIGIEIEERYCEIAATRCSQGVLGLSA